ncbi:hypothetical protein BDF21DRAFT_422880 [Thamnidium elegans]|nr:hypothetical protein BDF21DRAFT_422880 [Thamnidium elegans]
MIPTLFHTFLSFFIIIGFIHNKMVNNVSSPPQTQTSFFSDVIAAIANAKQTANQDFDRFWNKYFSKINALNDTSSVAQYLPTHFTRDEKQECPIDIDRSFEKRKMFFSDDESVQNLLPRTKSRKKHKRPSVVSRPSSSQSLLYYCSSDSSCSTSPRPIFSRYQFYTPEKLASPSLTGLTEITLPPRVTRKIPKNTAEASFSPNNSSPVRINNPTSSSKPEKRLCSKSVEGERLTPSKVKMINDNEIDKRIVYLENKIRALQFKLDEYSFSIPDI